MSELGDEEFSVINKLPGCLRALYDKKGNVCTLLGQYVSVTHGLGVWEELGTS